MCRVLKSGFHKNLEWWIPDTGKWRGEDEWGRSNNRDYHSQKGGKNYGVLWQSGWLQITKYTHHKRIEE